MTKEALPNARTILSEELKLAHWHDLTDPQKIFEVLDSCMDRTYKQVRSACWGNKVRTIACDVLFKEAQTSVALARSSMEALTVSRVSATEKDGRENSPDWIQPILLLLGTVLVMVSSIHGLNIFRILLGVLAALCILVALLREIQRLLSGGIGVKILNIATKLLKKSKLLKLIQKGVDLKPKQSAAVKFVLDMNAAALEEECLRQMDVIDSNLGLFHDPVQQKDDTGTLLPLVRTILQEKYACEDAFPESVEAELAQYLHANDLHAVDYDEQHASFFQTQPMDETFTIFPAIVDGKGCVIEHGIAGVRED